MSPASVCLRSLISYGVWLLRVPAVADVGKELRKAARRRRSMKEKSGHAASGHAALTYRLHQIRNCHVGAASKVPACLFASTGSTSIGVVWGLVGRESRRFPLTGFEAAFVSGRECLECNLH